MSGCQARELLAILAVRPSCFASLKNNPTKDDERERERERREREREREREGGGGGGGERSKESKMTTMGNRK